MPSCPDSSSLDAFAMGSGSRELRAAVERHIDGCAPCGRVVAELIRIYGPSEAGDGSRGSRDEAPEPPPLERGARVSRYEVLERIGSGGMGVVYAAYDPLLTRVVALKVMRAPDEEGAARLLREARALARLAHPHVVAVHDVGIEQGRFFLAMEAVAGTTLRGWLAAQPRTWAEILDKVMQAGRGLAAAHRAGILHRDFKPENVLVGHDGRARVTDFGLARWMHAEGDRPWSSPSAAWVDDARTSPGGLVGTPAYMAPEQLFGGAVGPEADQYALCVTLFEALYGARPFPARTLDELLRVMSSDREIAPPAQPRAPRWLFPIVRRGLLRDPSRRHVSIDALLERLAEGLQPDSGGLHVTFNAILQLLLGVAHTATSALMAYAFLAPHDSPETQQAGLDAQRVQFDALHPALFSSVFAFVVLLSILFFTGWLPVGAVWAPINAYGLFRRRWWAPLSTVLYAFFALFTCVGTPTAIYTLVTLWSHVKRDARRR